MPTQFSMYTDVRGVNAFGLQFTDTAYSATLAASTATSLTIPGSGSLGGGKTQTKNIWLAVFSYTPGSEIWVANNATAAVPVGAAFAATLSEMNPAARVVLGADILSFITSGSNNSVSVILYSLS